MRRESTPPLPNRRSRQYSDPDVFSDEHALGTLDTLDSLPNNDAGVIEPSRQRRSTRTPTASQIFSRSRLGSLRQSDNSYGLEGISHISTLGYSRSTASQTHDGPSGSIRREPSDASTSFISRAQSPYRGTTGPSHPYAMYNQDQDNGVGRAASNATMSTTRTPLQNYSGPSGPSHPYGMYAQNTVSEEDLTTNNLPLQQAPGVNPGSSQTYQRRLGPDGEDADDLIGPDGHTEQLPPYTKYPNEHHPKERTAIPERATNSMERPPQDSQETLNNSPAGYREDRSLVFDPANNQSSPGHARTSGNFPAAGSPPQTNISHSPNSPPADEGGNFKEVAARRNKRKICGLIPLWLLIVVVVFILVIIIGAIVGGVLRRKDWEHNSAGARSSQPPA